MQPLYYSSVHEFSRKSDLQKYADSAEKLNRLVAIDSQLATKIDNHLTPSSIDKTLEAFRVSEKRFIHLHMNIYLRACTQLRLNL